MDILAAIKREDRKARKATRQDAAPINRDTSGCESLGPLRR
jgi:hypothetical protein